MAFWGAILKPGEQPFTLHSDGGSRRLRITQATLVEADRYVSLDWKSVVRCTVGNEESVVLCTLSPKLAYRCHFNLEFEESEDVVFSLRGPRPIHLAGYFLKPSTSTTTTATTTDSCKTCNHHEQADVEKTPRDHCSNNNCEQADIEKTMRDHCINNVCGQLEHDPCDSVIAGSSITENLLPIGGATVEEFGTDKRIGGKQVAEELVRSSDASQLPFICTEKKSEVENSKLLVEIPQIEELLERDLMINDDVGPHKIDLVVQDENTKGTNNVIAAMTESEQIQPDTIEINNDIAAMTENKEVQPDTIEIYNFNAPMTESEEIVPDSEDDSDNDAGNASTDNHVKLSKQKIKNSIAEHDKVIVESIETNMKEGTNMNTIGCIQKQTVHNDSEVLHIEGGEVSTRNHSKSKKKETNQTWLVDNILIQEISQNINKERKTMEGVDEKIIAESANSEGKPCSSSNGKDDKGDDGLYLKAAKDADVEDGMTKGGVLIGDNSCKAGGCPNEEGARILNGGTDGEGNEDEIKKLGFCNIENQTQKNMLANDKSSFLLPSIDLGLEVTQNLKPRKKKKRVKNVISGCSNDDGCNSNGLLSKRVMHDQDHNSVVMSAVLETEVSVKLKKKKRKGGYKESKLVVDNVKEKQNQLVDEKNNICVRDENARFKDNGGNADKLQESISTNNQKVVDLSVLKESKKIKKVKVKAFKIQGKSINNDCISQDIVLAPTPSSDLKSELHNEQQVADCSVLKEKGKQMKRKLKTNMIHDKSTKTKTITVLALPVNLQNLIPVTDSPALKEKRKLKKRKLETSKVSEKSSMIETGFRSVVLALPANKLKVWSIYKNDP